MGWEHPNEKYSNNSNIEANPALQSMVIDLKPNPDSSQEERIHFVRGMNSGPRRHCQCFLLKGGASTLPFISHSSVLLSEHFDLFPWESASKLTTFILSLHALWSGDPPFAASRITMQLVPKQVSFVILEHIEKYQQKHRLKIQWLRSSLGPPHPTAVCLDWSPGPTSSLSFLIIPKQQHVLVRVLGFPAFHAQNPAWVSGFWLQPTLA